MFHQEFRSSQLALQGWCFLGQTHCQLCQNRSNDMEKYSAYIGNTTPWLIATSEVPLLLFLLQNGGLSSFSLCIRETEQLISKLPSHVQRYQNCPVQWYQNLLVFSRVPQTSSLLQNWLLQPSPFPNSLQTNYC